MSEYRFGKPWKIPFRGLKALLAASAALALTALALAFFSQLPQRALAGVRADAPLQGMEDPLQGIEDPLKGMNDPLQGGESLQVDVSAGEVITISPTITPRYPAETVPQWLVNTVNPAAANDELVMVLSAPAEIDNGDTITYNLSVTNRSGSYRSNIRILDVLPKDADGKYILSEVWCTPTCGRAYQTEVIREPLGSTVTVTITEQVSWTVSLNDGQSTNVAFWGPVVGQDDGTTFENWAFGNHPDIGTATSNDVQTIVRVRPSQPGYPSLSAAPTWLSADLGGTMSMDWGDFDQDGDLDLVIASTAGTFIYINREGRLKSYPPLIERYALGARWADFDNDGQLELVVVGESVDNTATGLSPVYFYEESGGAFQQTHVFTSPTQLVRVEPGDYDNDGDLDIIVTTNSINASCPVRMYENLTGTLSFSDSHTECVSKKAAANISPVDYDNDGDLDLVTGEFPNTVRLWINGGSMGSTFVTSATLLPALSFLPYDFAWGDYDGDDDLDLAAAFPLQRRARLYRNDAGTLTFHRDFRTTLFRTPLAVEWGDFDGDGTLDLAVADAPPKIYLNKDGAFAANEPQTQQTSFVQGQIWSMAAADADVDGDLDLMIGNRDGSSLLFTTFSPFLNDSLSSVGALNTSHVAWGDVDDDGDIDLLYAARQPLALRNAWIYKNNGGSFSLGADDFSLSGAGPRTVAFGDSDNDRDLDFALSTIDGVHIYVNGAGTWMEDILDTSDDDVNALAWGDAESDGDLDLFVGQNGQNTLYINQGGTMANTPQWTSAENEDTTSVAWGDYDGDLHLDVAVANRNGRVRVYHNNHDQTFTSAWQSAASYNARSVAWGDVDGDGDLDLAVGNYGQINVIFENVDGTLGTSPIWDSSPELYNTTSIAWGDWDNDGDLDLAVGNYGQADQVYDNPGSLPLEWRWTSTETLQTTAVAWGDQDGDGDLDLAISQDGGGQVGVYESSYAYPSHLHPPSYSGPLPNNPAYVSIERPGSTADAYFYSTQEILGKPASPTVTIEYMVYDAEGDRIVDTVFQYSLDGGGTWQQATPAVAPTRALTATPTGTSLTFEWDAQGEAVPAIGDNALFRISITHTNPSGPVQEANSSATSPPFRLEGTTCAWPEGPEISYDPINPDPGQPVDFEGDIQPGTGSEQVVYTWDFGDGSDPVDAQDVQHVFAQPGVFQVRLTVTSAPCPIQKQLSVVRTITVGSGIPNIYLPLVLKAYSGN